MSIRRLVLTMLLFIGFCAPLLSQVKGRIALSSAPQSLPAHTVGKDQVLCGPQVPNESMVVGKKLELANVFVLLANLKPDSLPPATVRLDIAKCSFKPHAIALLRGDSLMIRNTDPAAHHSRGYLYPLRPGWNQSVTKEIFGKESTTVFNIAFPSKGAADIEKLDAPGLLEIRSEDGHDWMKAYVLISPHRFFAVSNAKGEFTLEGLPAGQYDMILWHETLGVKRQLLEVPAGKGTELLVTWEDGAQPGTAAEDSLTTAAADSVSAVAAPDSMAGKQ